MGRYLGQQKMSVLSMVLVFAARQEEKVHGQVYSWIKKKHRIMLRNKEQIRFIRFGGIHPGLIQNIEYI